MKFWLSYNANNSPKSQAFVKRDCASETRNSEDRKSRAFGLVGWGGSACSKTGLRSHLHTLIRSQRDYFQAKQKGMAQPVNDEQRYGDDQLAEPALGTFRPFSSRKGDFRDSILNGWIL